MRVPQRQPGLADPTLYVRAIERLYQKHRDSGRAVEWRQAGVPLAVFYDDRRRLAKALAREVASGEYAIGEAIPRVVEVEGKLRTLYTWSLTDWLLHHALTEVLEAYCRPFWNASLYSYRKKYSALRAARDVSNYVRRHASETPAPDRGLWICQRDVAQYTESIVVAPWSELWAQIEAIVGPRMPAAQWKIFRRHLERAVRPHIRREDGVYCPWVGLPTGSPLCPLIFNLHLLSLDSRLRAIVGGFYGRYGDDLIFLHPQREEAERAGRWIDSELGRLQLRTHPEKRRDALWTSAGFSPDGRAGTATVEWLGLRVRFTGEIGLAVHRLRRLRQELRARIGRSKRLLGNSPGEVQLVCDAVNAAIHPTSDFAEPRVGGLLALVDDRAQLKELDYWIAREVIASLTGMRSAKAFRAIPYAQLRETHGLVSLVSLRNRRGRSCADSPGTVPAVDA